MSAQRRQTERGSGCRNAMMTQTLTPSRHYLARLRVAFGDLGRQDRIGSARIHVGQDLHPALWPTERHRDNGTRPAFVGEVGEAYRAHVKSSGRGIGKLVGMTPGCFRLAAAWSALASSPTKSSPAATTAYFPGYVSTKPSKCSRIQAWSSRDGRRGRFEIVRRVMNPPSTNPSVT